MTRLFTFFGGRKMTLSLAALGCVVWAAKHGATGEAYTAIALIVASFAGANGWVESSWAKKGKPDG